MNLKLTSRSLLFGLSCLLAASSHAQTILYQQDWSGYADGASVLGDGFYSVRGTNTPAGNTAIVHHNQYGSYLSIVSTGYSGTSYSPQVRTDSSFAPIALSATQITRISIDMRYQSPGVELNRGSGNPYSSFRFSGDGGSSWFGFFGLDQVFAGGGTSSQTIDGFDMLSWYRLEFDLNPQDGSMVLTAFDVDALGQTGDQVAQLTATTSGVVSQITNFTFELIRPGTSTDLIWSADFANITISTVPEPATVAGLLGGAALLLSLGVRVLRRRRAGAARS